MERVNLVNANNEMISANIIRYFEMDNNNYLIYSLNELDDQNYVKLYAVKIDNQNGVLMSSNVVDETAWTNIKELIKVIVRGNKEGRAEVADLDYKELESLKITESRAFKLSDQLVQLLSANKKEFVEIQPQSEVNLEPVTIDTVISPEANFEPTITPEVNLEPVVEAEPTVEQEVAQPNAEVDYYKNLYQQEKAKNEELVNKFNEIKKLID